MHVSLSPVWCLIKTTSSVCVTQITVTSQVVYNAACAQFVLVVGLAKLVQRRGLLGDVVVIYRGLAKELPCCAQADRIVAFSSSASSQ